MTSPEVVSVQDFHSIPQLYRGDRAAKDLQLRLRWWGDALEFTLVNQRYSAIKLEQYKSIAVTITLYIAFKAIVLYSVNSVEDNEQWWPLKHFCIIDLAFLLCLLYNIQNLLSLIKSEKLLFCLDFALQLQTERFMSRSTNNLFISAADIHDVVLNEVIENLDVHYVLIVRTKGRLFEQQPIIPIFNRLRPSIDCLEIVYNNLNKIMKNTEKL